MKLTLHDFCSAHAFSNNKHFRQLLITLVNCILLEEVNPCVWLAVHTSEMLLQASRAETDEQLWFFLNMDPDAKWMFDCSLSLCVVRSRLPSLPRRHNRISANEIESNHELKAGSETQQFLNLNLTNWCRETQTWVLIVHQQKITAFKLQARQRRANVCCVSRLQSY